MQNYIEDTDTKNASFIKVSTDLKFKGIKNYTFFLKLYDSSLKNVDPYASDLTDDQKFRIIIECVINPWYFLREVARIPCHDNIQGIPYELNLANLSSTWCFVNGIDQYEIIPRPLGKTQSTIAILLWAFLFGTMNSEFMLFSESIVSEKYKLYLLKKQYDLLPLYLKIKDKSINNVTNFQNPNNGNSIVIGPKAQNYQHAERIGEKLNQPIQYYDNFEFIKYNKIIVNSSLPAFKAASKNAQQKKLVYGRIFTSVIGNMKTEEAQYGYMMSEQAVKWDINYLDMDIDNIRKILSQNSLNDIMYITYSYLELEKTKEWFDNMSKMFMNKSDIINREILLKRE